MQKREYLRVEFPKHKEAREGVPERKEGAGDGGILSGTASGFPVGSVGRGGMQEPKA